MPTSSLALHSGLRVYFLATGIVGIVAIVSRVPPLFHNAPSGTKASVALIYIAFLIPFLGLATAGLVSTRGKAFYGLAIALQALQVPIWTVEDSAYRFLAGLYAGPMLHERSTSYFYEFGTSVHLRWAPESVSPVLALNLVPLVVIVAVLVLERNHRSEDLTGVNVHSSHTSAIQQSNV